MIPLQCKSCGAAMRGTDFDRRLGVVVCSHCGAIFDLTKRTDRSAFTGELGPVSDAPPPDRAPVALPERFSVDRVGDRSLVVRWRWFQPTALFLLAFAVAWDAFLVFWYGMALTGPDTPWLMVVFPLAHVAVGVAITYTSLASLLNQTRLVCTKGVLKVRHGPLPWYPQPTLPVRDLEQLYVQREVKHSKNGTTVKWHLRAVTRAHTGQPVVKGLDTLQQALWLEQELEDMLDIRDRPVAGEYRGEGGSRA